MDVTDFDGKPSGRIELIDAGTLSVDLSKATVLFVDRAGTRGVEAKLIARNGSLYAHWPRGLSVIVR